MMATLKIKKNTNENFDTTANNLHEATKDGVYNVSYTTLGWANSKHQYSDLGKCPYSTTDEKSTSRAHFKHLRLLENKFISMERNLKLLTIFTMVLHWVLTFL